MLAVAALGLLAAIGAGGVATAANAEANGCSSLVSLKRTAERTGVLTRMTEATRLAGLDSADVDLGPLTLLAPTDEAFDSLPEGFRKRLLAPENREHLTALLMHHAVMGEYTAERLRNARAPDFTIPTVDASGVLVSIRRGISIEGAHFIEADIRATDGVLHLIDKVLIPDSVRAALWDAPDMPRKTLAGITE